MARRFLPATPLALFALGLVMGLAPAQPVAAQGAPPSAASRAAACGAPAALAEVLRAINALRSAGALCGRPGAASDALPPLAWNEALGVAARERAADLAQRLAAGRAPEGALDGGEQARMAGYPWQFWREALGGNLASPAVAVSTWRATGDACEALLHPRLTEVGVACVAVSAGAYSNVWSLISAQR